MSLAYLIWKALASFLFLKIPQPMEKQSQGALFSRPSHIILDLKRNWFTIDPVTDLPVGPPTTPFLKRAG